jgi:hypothetical protein
MLEPVRRELSRSAFPGVQTGHRSRSGYFRTFDQKYATGGRRTFIAPL